MNWQIIGTSGVVVVDKIEASGASVRPTESVPDVCNAVVREGRIPED